jgi:hypothetical protein
MSRKYKEYRPIKHLLIECRYNIVFENWVDVSPSIGAWRQKKKDSKRKKRIKSRKKRKQYYKESNLDYKYKKKI